ncbi:unnamed protein product [Rotaria sordida]|uniref:Uncharacterized protein n=1 Tax=Rotaria sordida TaxID=392033 RepID=A0A819K022_9BILA|nr:unnamed protein product [Rotaria sordida]CAF3937629.1 unnamed protein product [Rotaria sordida]
MATGVNPVTAIATSAITTVTGHKSPLDLIYATGKFLTSDRDPQTVNYLPQTCNKVSELYTAVRGQLLNDITTNFFANLVLEIQQYKSISIENSLQNRLNRMSDKDIAYMANIEIESSRQKVLNNHESIKRLEQARDSIEDVIALLNNKNIENNIFNMNNDSNNIKKRIRATHEDTQVSIDSNQDEDKSDDETSKFEDEHELMRYDDKTSNLELGFLNGDSLKSDVKFVEQRQQQQPTLITTMASNVRMIADGFEQISSLPISINSILQQREDTSSYIVSDDEEDRNSVIENPINKKGSFLIH